MSKAYPGLADGIWYFHIKARQQPAGAPFGATTHFQVLIDTVPPKPFEVVLVGEANLNDVSRTPMIEFKVEDELSGIDHYDVHLDDEFIETVTASPYSFEGLSGGPHVVKIVAFDRAGNLQTASLSFIVTVPARLLEGCTLFLYLLILANLILLLVVLFLLWLLSRRKKQEPHMVDKRIKEFKLDFDQSLEQLRRRIDYRLTKLMKKTPPDREKTSPSIAKDFDDRIDKTKRKFDDKLKEF